MTDDDKDDTDRPSYGLWQVLPDDHPLVLYGTWDVPMEMIAPRWRFEPPEPFDPVARAAAAVRYMHRVFRSWAPWPTSVAYRAASREADPLPPERDTE